MPLAQNPRLCYTTDALSFLTGVLQMSAFGTTPSELLLNRFAKASYFALDYLLQSIYVIKTY